MKKKIIFALAVLMLLIPGGIFGVTKWIEHQDSPDNVSDVLDDKGVKLSLKSTIQESVKLSFHPY